MDDYSRFSPPSSSQDFLHTFVQAVHSLPLDLQHIGSVAVRLLHQEFATRTLTLYLGEGERPLLHLLAQVPSPDAFSLPSSPFEPCSLLASVLLQRKPLFLTDLHDPSCTEFATILAPVVDSQTRGCLCLPLWCGDTQEGALIAGFATSLIPTSGQSYAFVSCGLHLATALSRARMHLTIADTHLRLYEILDQVPEGMVIVEATTGIVRYANPVAAQILGISLQELVDAPLQLPPHAQEPLAREQHLPFFWTFAIARALSGKTLQQMETIIMRPDGTHVPVLCSSAPLRAMRGIQSGAILLLQDITLQKRLEHDKNAFLSLASHELRTPLTAVMGYASLLNQASNEGVPLDRKKLQTATDLILGQSEQMAFLINEMLNLSALDQGQFVLHLAAHNLVPLLARIVETQAATTKKHQLRLVLDEQVAGRGCLVQIDAPRLIQALTSLVNNAIKYSPEGGDIEVGMCQEDQPSTQVVLWVKDHGLGITHDDLPHVFDRFYRSPTLDSSLGGLGIGLYLAWQVIMYHQGHIRVESVAGRGSTFFVVLPMKRQFPLAQIR